MASVLLVGGTHHGEMVEMPIGGAVVHMPAAELFPADGVDPQASFPVENYSIVRLALFGRTVHVGLSAGSTPSQAIPALLSGPAFTLWSQSQEA